MKNAFLYLFVFLFLGAVASSCDGVKSKTKEVIGKTGETVGEGTSEFVNGVSKGVDRTFECKVELSPSLIDQGMGIGKFYIPDSLGKSYTLSAFISFNKDFKQDVTVSVYDEKGKEYGRISKTVEAKAGEGKFEDFVFDRRTDIESKSKFVLQ